MKTFSHEERKEAIRISLTRKLKAAGLHDFIPKAVDFAHNYYGNGKHSAFSAISEGVRFAHELEETWH